MSPENSTYSNNSLYKLYEDLAAPYATQFQQTSTYTPAPKQDPNAKGVIQKAREKVGTIAETVGAALGYVGDKIPTKQGIAGALPETLGTKIVRAEILEINEGKKLVETLKTNLPLLQKLQERLEEAKKLDNKSAKLASIQGTFTKIAKNINLTDIAQKINGLQEKVASFVNISKDNPFLAIRAKGKTNSDAFLEQERKEIDELDDEQKARCEVLEGDSDKTGLISLHMKVTEVLESVRLGLVIAQYQEQISEIQNDLATNFAQIADLNPSNLRFSFNKNQARPDADTEALTDKIDAAVKMFKNSLPIFEKFADLQLRVVNQKFAENFETLAAVNKEQASKLLSSWNKVCLDLNCVELDLAVFKGIVNAVLKTNRAQIEGEAIYFAVDGASKYADFNARWKKPFADLVRLPDFASNIFKARTPEAGKEVFDLTLQDLSISKELTRLLHIAQNLKEQTKYTGEANSLGVIALKSNNSYANFSYDLHTARTARVQELLKIIEQTSSYKHDSSNNIFAMAKAKFFEAVPAEGVWGMLGWNQKVEASTLN